MSRVNMLPITSTTLSSLKQSMFPTLTLSSSRRLSIFASRQTLLPKTHVPTLLHLHSWSLKRVPSPMASRFPSLKASFNGGSSSGDGREILVQHLLVKEDDLKLLLELQQRISQEKIILLAFHEQITYDIAEKKR